MQIGSTTDYSSLLQNYYVPTIPSVSIAEVQKQDSQSNLIKTQAAGDNNASNLSQPPSRQKMAALEDISITFNKQEDFDYIGQDSDIQSLDIHKAISDMKKDQVLQQYQYFVGSSSNLVTENSDGTVIAKF